MNVFTAWLITLQIGVVSAETNPLDLIYDPLSNSVRSSTYISNETTLLSQKFGCPTELIRLTEEARNPKTKELKEVWRYKKRGLEFQFHGVATVLDDGSLQDRKWRRLKQIQLTEPTVHLKEGLGIGVELAKFQEVFPNLVAMNREKTIWQAGGSYAPRYVDNRASLQVYISINVEFDSSLKAQRITWRYENDH